jgi:F-type H+-transporting ATPase subunit epsilon
MPLSISLVTPEKDVLDMECDEVIVPGVYGELGLLPGHIPLISAMKAGVLTTFSQGKRRHFVVSSGFVEIDDDRITILAGTCEPADEVDVERAKRALAEARKKLDALSPEDPNYAGLQARAHRAEARLDAASRAH